MFKPQDIGRDGGINEPLFQLDFSSNDEKFSWIVAGMGAAIAALFYGLGATLPNAGLSGVAFAVAIVTVVIFIFLRSRFNKHKLTEEEIDEKVEQYKQDLVDTYNGYDVEYSAEEILLAADKYRMNILSQELESEDEELSSALDIFKQMGADVIQKRDQKKKEKDKKGRGKKVKKNAKVPENAEKGFLKE